MRRPLPDLRERVPGAMAGPWRRWADAKWLGPYTPSNVPHWVRKLMRRDPQIALGLIAFKAPFFGIEYRVEGSTPEIRAFVQKTLLERREVFEKLLWSVLNAIDFGFQAHELLWRIEDVTVDEDGPGGLPERTFFRAYTLREFKDLDPERVELVTDRQTGRLAGIRVDGSVYLPSDKVLLATHQAEHQNWWGESALDRAYHPWYWVNHLYLYMTRYLEQKGNPPLIGRAPYENRTSEDGGPPRNCLDLLGAELATLRGGGNATIPHEVDAKGHQRWDISELTHSARLDQFLPAIQHLEDLKLRAMLVPERIVTQQSTVGSFGMSETHLDVFFSNLEVIKRFLILGTLNAGPVQLLVRNNFGAKAPVPRLAASELSRQSKALLADIVKQALLIPRTLDDGRVYSTASIIDDIRALEALNIPHRRPQDVAVAPEGGRQDQTAAPSAPSAPTAEDLARHSDTTACVARRYGVSRHTVCRWAKAGAPCLPLPGGRYRFNPRELHDWLAQHQAAKAEEVDRAA